MICWIVRRVALVAFALSISSVAFAQDTAATMPQTEQEIEARLKTFDPAAVAAARHYYESPKVKGGLMSMIASLEPTIIANAQTKHGTTLSDADKAKIVDAVNKAMAANLDLLIGMNMIAALEVLSKDQLIALDQFYSSPTGQAILDKMPEIGRRLPEMMQAFLPKFLASVKEDLQSSGFDKP